MLRTSPGTRFRPIFATLCWTAFALSTASAPAQDKVPQAPKGDATREALAQYYKSSEWPKAWDALSERLASGNTDERRTAATQLVELMEQAYQDEKSGKAPWLATPFWGGRMENPARNLRRAVVDSLEKATAEPEILPLVRWLLAKEPQMRLQETVAGFLGKIDGPDAEALRRELIVQPHADAIVVGTLLAQLNERKAALPADRLTELCHHHRKVIREAARKLNQTLKGGDPGPFDPVRALQSPAVRKTLDDLQAMMIDLPGKEIAFVEVTTRYEEKGNEKERVAEVMDQINQPRKDQGWLLKKENDTVILFSPYGTRETHRDKENTQIRVGKRIENGYQSWDVNVVSSVSVADMDIAGYVKQIVAVRAKGNEDFELSPRGGFTGQFQGQGASLVEAILAAWLDSADRKELLAAVLLPALDTLYEDRHLVEMSRHQLGQILGNRMLVAFVGNRDYPEALKLAQTLAKAYPDTQFYEYARGLSEELPRRMEDFKSHRLPTPAEWAEMKKKMSRREQIDFLCQRLRLLNCFQWGQPGGYSSGSTQYAEPGGLSGNAAWGLGRGKTEVINPVSELTGERGIFVRGDEADRGLNLKIADIPTLVPYLREDWFILCVSFWRDFHPDRTLGRSRPYVAGWINGLANHDLCQLREFEKMDPKEQEAHLAKIVAWVEANKNRTPEEILATAIAAAIDNREEWHKVSGRLHELAKMKSPRALGFVEKYLAKPDEDGYSIPEMLALVETIDPKKAVEWAPKFLRHKRGGLRMQCAMLLFDAGKTDETVPVLAELLKKGSAYEIGGHVEKALTGLLKLGGERARAAALGIADNKHLRGPRTDFDRGGRDSLHRPTILPILEKAGRPDTYRVYLELLDTDGHDFGSASYGTPVAKLAVNEILHGFAKGDADLTKIRELTDFEQQRVAVRRWVEMKASQPAKK